MSIIKGLDCHNHGINGYGNPADGVMIVGIAPGRNEMKVGRPLVGTSGQLLDAVLESVGWSRTKCYCTNLVCWFTSEPSLAEILECKPRLEAEIALYKPKIIITLGKLASESLTGKLFGSIMGCPIWSTKYCCWILPTLHPASFLHGYDGAIVTIVRDLAKITNILNWPPNVADFTYEVINDVEVAQSILNNWFPDEYVAIDVETTNPDTDEVSPYDERLLSFAISNGTHTYVFPTRVVKSVYFPKYLRYTFHNGMFDTQAIRKFLDVELPIVEDTMLMSYALDERQGVHKLKQLAKEYCGAPAYEEEIAKVKKHMLDVPQDILYKYNAADACYTARLAQVLWPMVEADNMADVYTKLLIPAANAFKEIQYRGMYISKETVYRLGAEWTERWVKDEEELVADAASYGFKNKTGRININSPKQLSELLFTILHLPGGPSTRKEILDTLVDEHPFVSKLMAFRRLDHMLSSYIVGVDDDIKDDSRVHANVLLHGTETGRLSYRKPPLQTIPKVEAVGEDLGRVREIFTPTNRDYIIVEADYSKSEIWGAYCHSKDPQMLTDLLSGDYHSQVASSVFNKPISEVTKLERQQAKTVTFGLMYGRGADSLAQKTFKSTRQVAQGYLNNWWARYPLFRKWVNSVKETAINEGEIVSLFGRKRRFKVIRDETAYHTLNEAVNFPIQSLSTDCSLTSVVELHEQLKGWDSYVLIAIHDSIVFEVATRNLDEVMHLIHDSMTKSKLPGIPGLPIDFKIGMESWGHAKEYDIHTCQMCGKTGVYGFDFFADIIDDKFILKVWCKDGCTE
jgi:DNA polymerase-1